MPATADQLILTAQDVLTSALERGVTGRLSRSGRRGTAREVYVMQGQILAAHGPDDGPWVVRRLVNSGALTERQGKAFIRRLTRGTPFEELLRGHVPDALLAELLAGRFRQNLLDFLSSPPPIDFHPMDTIFVPNLQSGHDTMALLQSTAELRERIGPITRHRGPLTLRPGPSMPASRQQARVVDLCDPSLALRDLLTFSPFEAGETLAHVMAMMEDGALVSDEGVRLQRTRGHGPSTDYAFEELFSIESPESSTPSGVPAAPIAPEYLAMLREEADHSGGEDFGPVPPAFELPEEPGSSAEYSGELPKINTSHLVLVNDQPSEPPPQPGVPGLDAPPVPTAVMAGVVEEDSLMDVPDHLDADVLTGVDRPPLSDTHRSSPPVTAPPMPAERSEDDLEPFEDAPTADTDIGSIPDSWQDLSPFHTASLSASLDAASEELETAPVPGIVSADTATVYEEPTIEPGLPDILELGEPPPPEDFSPEAAMEPSPAPSEADHPPAPDPLPDPVPSSIHTEPPAPSPAPVEVAAAEAPSSDPFGDDDDDDLFGDHQDIFQSGALQSPFSETELDAPSAPELSDAPAPSAGAPSPEVEEDDDADGAPGSDAPPAGNALVDAARRYLEEAREHRKERNKRPIRRDAEPEPVSTFTGQKKFTGFDFDVDDTEMAMFDDHDRYRGGGDGQFTLNKNLLDKVELLPESPAGGVQLGRTAEPELPEEESLIEMGEASAEEEASAGVVALAFSAPKLDADQILFKIAVAGEVAVATSRVLDAHVGPGVGQATIQLLVDATTGPYGRLFQQVEVRANGAIDEERVFANLQQRPDAEQRSLLDRGLKDFIERALSTAAEELSDEALDILLADVAGYQQRLRM